MPRIGVTYDQVAAAAEAIAAAGENTTINRVREKLGTGSPNTIHKHLSAWLQTRPAPRKPADLPETIQAAILREIEKQATEAKGEAESRLAQAQERADELARAGEQLETEVADLTEALAAMRAERDIAHMNLEGLAEEVATLKAAETREREAAEAARIQAAETRLRTEGQVEALQEARTEIARLRESLETERTARETSAREAAELRGELKALRAPKRTKATIE